MVVQNALRRLALAKSSQTRLTTRKFIAMPQGEAVPIIGGLIASNVAVWGAWNTVSEKTMIRHFTMSTDDIARRPYTLLTSVFSHRDGYHLLGNMVTLFFFGPECIAYMGTRQFLTLYFGGGLFSNACQLGVSASTTKSFFWMQVSLSFRADRFSWLQERFLGASGAVNATVAWSVLANPWRLIIIFAEFIPVPMPAILYGAVFIGKDVAQLLGIRVPYLAEGGQSVAHGAHVAGAIFGAAHFAKFRGAGRLF